MQNDTISRSALIADLENRKVTAGDPVIKFLFDRLIDIVKGQPVVPICHELQAALQEPPVVKECMNCKYFDQSAGDLPCRVCDAVGLDGDPSRWEARE